MLSPASSRASQTPRFDVSYAAGIRDASGQPASGTEIRVLTRHDRRLFAATGDWKETGEAPGARILVLDQPGGDWRVDNTFDDRLPDGRRRHIAVSALFEAVFHTDANGLRLARPASLLLASTWDITGARTIFARDERTGQWPGTMVAQDRPLPGFLPQIRAFGCHHDRQTGIDLVFAADSSGIFVGAYNPDVPGLVRWSSKPELATTGLGADNFPGLAGRLRISSFAEASGRLFAAVGQQVWVRQDGAQDGATSQWRLFYTNPSPYYSQTGLRGLTTVSDPHRGDILLTAVEGRAARIVRIDPATGVEGTDLDLASLLDRSWGTRVSYVIAAYNDMAHLPHPLGAEDLAIGLEAFIPPTAPRPPGHNILPVVNGLEAGAWFLIRHPDGRYDLHQVTAQLPGIGENLVAARTIVASPFAGDANTIYIGGYDANDPPAHGTAWVVHTKLDRHH